MRNEFLLGWRGQGSSLDATFICEGSGNVCGCSDTHELISVCTDLWKNVPCQKGLATMRRSRCLYEFMWSVKAVELAGMCKVPCV